MELIAGKRKVGSFVNIWHGIAGDVFALDDQTILIEDFTYDGQVEYQIKIDGNVNHCNCKSRAPMHSSWLARVEDPQKMDRWLL